MYRTPRASHGCLLNINYDKKKANDCLFWSSWMHLNLKTGSSPSEVVMLVKVSVYLLAWDHICVFFRVNQVALAVLGRKAPPASQWVWCHLIRSNQNSACDYLIVVVTDHIVTYCQHQQAKHLDQYFLGQLISCETAHIGWLNAECSLLDSGSSSSGNSKSSQGH